VGGGGGGWGGGGVAALSPSGYVGSSCQVVVEHPAKFVSELLCTCLNYVCVFVLQYVVVRCSVLQCVVVCCSVLQCVVVCCCVLMCVVMCCSV